MATTSARLMTGYLTEREELTAIKPQCPRSQRAPDASDVGRVGTQFEAMDISNRCPSLSFSGHTSINHDTWDWLATSAAKPGLNLATPPQRPQTTTNPSVPLVSSWSLVDTETRDGSRTNDDGGRERAVSVIRRELVLDRTAESNALPFVLQGFGAWIGRLALDPVKLSGIVRNFVCSHFGDGDESRWIIGLLANVGSRVGSVEFVEGRSNYMISMLQTAVRRRLGTSNARRHTLIQALSSAIEAIIMQFYASPLSEAMTLMYESAPIFRQLCSDAPDAPVNLLSLLRDPQGCLWHFAYIDIIFSVLTDMPTLCQYEVTIPGSQPFPLYRLAQSQGDSVIQWLHGVPNQLVLTFAHMNSIRGDGFTPDAGVVASLERAIREIPPFSGSSSDRFLTIMRSIVQECWRQAALIYLYMAVCGEPSDTPRVKEACRRYMQLLNGTKPGRSPDEFLILTLQLISPAVQRPRDREVLKQRALGLYTRDRTHISTTFITFVMADVWARADAEKRPVIWSDVATSRRKLLGI